MKVSKKTTIGILLIGVVLILITVVTTDFKPTESDIRTEISKHESFDKLGMTISSYIENDRIISNDNTDTIWATVTAENEMQEYVADYIIEYTKRSKFEWQINNIHRETYYYTAKNVANPIEEDFQNLEYKLKYNLSNINFHESVLIESELSGIDGSPYCVYLTTFSGENDTFTLDAEIYDFFQFIPYEGWNYIDSGEEFGYENSVSIKPKKEPDKSLLEEEFSSIGISDFKIVSGEFVDDLTYKFICKGTDDKSLKYMKMYYDYSVICKFDTYVCCWSVSDFSSELYNVDINATGKWVYADGEGKQKYVFNIKSIDEKQVTFTCDLTITDWLMVAGEDTYTRSTNGETRTYEWEETSDADYSLITVDYLTGRQHGLANANYYYLEFRSYKGEKYDKSGFYFNDCLLTKKS